MELKVSYKLYNFRYFIVFLAIFVSFAYGEDNAGQLARIVTELQSQVLALQEARTQDQHTIRSLENKLHQHFDVKTVSAIDDHDITRTNIKKTETSKFDDKDTLSELEINTSGTDRVLARVFTTLIDPSNVSVESTSSQQPQINKDDLNEELDAEVKAIKILEHERRSLRRLDHQLHEMKLNLAEVIKAKEREVTVTEDLADFRLEADSLREEFFKIKREVEDLKAKREEDALAARRAKDNQVTTQWLLKTVEEFRHEMGEIAASVNLSAALNQKQKAETNLDLTRLDLSDLRKRMDASHVAQERDSAWITQLREELMELRTNFQNIATKHQNLVHEVTSIKEELLETVRFTKAENFKISSRGGSTNENPPSSRRPDHTSHHMKRHSHCKAEIEELHSQFSLMEYQQRQLQYELNHLKQNQSDLSFKVSALDSASTNLLNRTSFLDVEQKATSKHLDLIQHQTDETNLQAHNLKSIVNNITESGIKKLHASTVQLFETLENIENDYAKTISIIKKEMSKIEFNLAQAQSSVGQLRDEQTDHEEMLKSMKNDIKKVQMDSRKDRFKLLAVQADLINKTLQDSKVHNSEAIKQMRLSQLESKIVSLTKTVNEEKQEVDVMHKQIEEKADVDALSKWERTQSRLREVVFNLTGAIPEMKNEEQNIGKELEKFVQQLPKDCAMDAQQPLSAYKSGVYLVQHPSKPSIGHPKSVKVYCDMDTSGGQWTVLQRRLDGKQDFNQNWHQYKEGFGDVKGDFWLGNDLIHYFTTSDDYVLRIDLWDSTGRYKYAEYDTFRVLQESDGYRLAVAGYHGNASNALEYHNGMAFSTPDRDNDASTSTHCGQFYKSGWWYNHCQYVNINGRYNTGVTWYDIDGQEWSELTKVELKIKPLRLARRQTAFNKELNT